MGIDLVQEAYSRPERLAAVAGRRQQHHFAVGHIHHFVVKKIVAAHMGAAANGIQYHELRPGSQAAPPSDFVVIHRRAAHQGVSDGSPGWV